MDVLVTTRFVDRLLLAEHPDNPDAADTPIGAIVTATPPRALELARIGFATPIGMTVADLEQAARDYELAAIAVQIPAPVVPPVVPVADAAPIAADAEPVADDPETLLAVEPSDGGAVDLSK